MIVTGRRDGKYLEIAMSNPVASGRHRSKDGNKMAMSNIRQRYDIAYEGRAKVSVDADDRQFRVTLRFPMEEQ